MLIKTLLKLKNLTVLNINKYYKYKKWKQLLKLNIHFKIKM